jgi:hypothetical protein
MDAKKTTTTAPPDTTYAPASEKTPSFACTLTLMKRFFLNAEL